MSKHPEAESGSTKASRRRERRGPVVSLKFGGVEVTIHGWRGLVTLAVLVVVGAALYQQLRLPAGRRTWRGQVFGVVPYDFRVPTVRSLVASMWDPKNPNLFTDKPLGVGWNVNLARAVALARGARA